MEFGDDFRHHNKKHRVGVHHWLPAPSKTYPNYLCVSADSLYVCTFFVRIIKWTHIFYQNMLMAYAFFLSEHAYGVRIFLSEHAYGVRIFLSEHAYGVHIFLSEHA